MTRIAAAFAVAIFLSFISMHSFAESVSVKYGGTVELRNLVCDDETDSLSIRNVCFDVANNYMLVRVKNDYYQYCEIDPDTMSGLLVSPSTDKFYSTRIKGQFACRPDNTPRYVDEALTVSSAATPSPQLAISSQQ